MSNTTEIEAESAQQVPTTLETQEFVDAQDVPVEGVNNDSSPNPDNMEIDKPTPLDNGNSPTQTEVVADVNNLDLKSSPQQPHQDIATPALVDVEKRLAEPGVESVKDVISEVLAEPGVESVKDVISEANGTPDLKAETCAVDGITIFSSHAETAKPIVDIETKSPEGWTPDLKAETCAVEDIAIFSSHAETAKPAVGIETKSPEGSQNTSGWDTDVVSKGSNEPAIPYKGSSDNKAEVDDKNKTVMSTPKSNGNSARRPSFLLDENNAGNESGTEEEQSAFMKELDGFFREKGMEFKPPKFYGEGLNCLKLWRFVMRLGGYDKVTSCKLWRQVGESFNPPKTCTTVSWTFRGFYEKILLDYERYITGDGEIKIPIASKSEPKLKTKSKAKSGPNPEPLHVDNQASGSGRARRDAAARAMKGWHSLRFLGNGEVSGPIIKDKNSQREKDLKSVGLLKRKKPSYVEHAVKSPRKTSGVQLNVEVIDLGAPADWVKINVQKSKDSFEVYALVPGLLREEVRVQSDPAGRLVISGEPEHADNPWGVAPFKKVVSLPSRIDPHQTTAVVTLHGQLYVRVPFDQSD